MLSLYFISLLEISNDQGFEVFFKPQSETNTACNDHCRDKNMEKTCKQKLKIKFLTQAWSLQIRKLWSENRGLLYLSKSKRICISSSYYRLSLNQNKWHRMNQTRNIWIQVFHVRKPVQLLYLIWDLKD